MHRGQHHMQRWEKLSMPTWALERHDIGAPSEQNQILLGMKELELDAE